MAAPTPFTKRPYDFQAYAAGNKVYGGGRPFPTSGPVDPLGYRERDARTRMRRNALLKRMQANQGSRQFSSDWLRGSRL